ncbi:glycerol-3-phosphate 1-O-acyltransferase PlsB [Salinispirillum sp. LH 10-3-1]|uniref:Glycerol-3-phosphate acyltransferase n=1 Tax=Salinispirillum sp. LH 10-3-1 TaxID=2952525 RepID=A0AB38YIX6_9GAMM
MYALLKRLLSVWIRFDNSKTAELPKLQDTQPIIYVLRRQSLTDRIAADLFISKMGLPTLHKSIEQEPLVFLEYKSRTLRTLKRQGRSTALTQLCQRITDDPEQDIQLVPISVFWGRAPTKEKSLFKILFSDRWSIPGPVRKLFTVLVNGRSTFVEINQPLSLRELITEDQPVARLSRKVHRILRVHFNRVRLGVLGPDLSHRRTMMTHIVNSVQVREAIAHHARTQKTTPDKARKVATGYLEEIMADISYSTVRVLDLFLSRLWNKIYNGIRINNIAVVKQAAQDSAVIYVPCHRSHIDYLLLSYSLHSQGVPIPHIAAGKNLNMPIVGPILRRGGAFFMRRSFGGDKLYTAVFNEYLHMMFTRGSPVEYFVEGGRSRTGRTLEPKAGMLAMTVKSYLRDPSLPMKFVPVYIGYEKVFEANSYLKELRGKEKKSESIFDVIGTIRRLKNYGEVSLNFGTPIELQSILTAQEANWRDHNITQDSRPAWLAQTIQVLSNEVASRINQAAALNPVNVIGTVLLASPNHALDQFSIEQHAALYVSLLQEVPYSDTMTFPDGAPSDWLAHTVDMKMVRRIDHPMGALYSVNDHNAVLLTYYRNNIIHLLALPALLCCGLQIHGTPKTRDQLMKHLTLIYGYVRNELFMHWDMEAAQKVAHQYLDGLIARGLISVEGDFLIPSTDPSLATQFIAVGRLMQPTLERYYLTLAVLQAHGQYSLTVADLEAQAQQLAQRMSILNGLNAPEFFDKTLFRRFVLTLREKTVIATDAEQRITFDQRVPEAIAAAESLLNPELVRNVRWLMEHPQSTN